MTTGRKSRRLSFQRAVLGETRALWMHVDLHRFVNGLIFGLLLAALVAAINFQHTWPGAEQAIGHSLLILALCTICSIYLVTFESRRIRAFRAIGSVGILSIIPIAAAVWLPDFGLPVHVNPVVMVAFIFGIVYSERTAVMLSLMLCVLIGLSLQITHPRQLGAMPYDLAVVLFAGATVAALGCGKIRKRSKLLKLGLLSAVVQVALIAAAALRAGGPLDYRDAIFGFTNGIVWAVLVTALLPLIEQVFKVATGISLLELSDQSHPLLRQLSLEAPGTYHHSLILGNLAESAGEAIGINSLMLRVGAYYHDVGKLAKPEYFVENEEMQGSMHSNLSPTMSALIITAHTKDGAQLARDKGLPEPIVDLIQQHHGTSLVEFFYHRAKELNGTQVDPELFRHPGPKPQTKEAGVLLLVDSVESASRALPEPTPSRIARQVHDVINRKLIDGQLDECELTLTDVHKIEQNLIRSLTSVFHGRIKYPEPDEPITGRDQNGR